jgi:CrcB protein
MTLVVALAIGIVGGLGAVARFLLDGAVSGALGRGFPFGTFAVNIGGSLLLGVATGVSLSEDAHRLVGTGLLGAFTTFSTWVFESHRLSEDGELRLGTLNFAASLLFGVAAAWCGRELGSQL